MYLEILLSKATLGDISAMQKIVQPYVNDGIILHRSTDEIANTIRSYTLAKTQKQIVGFAALHIYSPNLAEVRMLTVDSKFHGKNIGTMLVKELIEEAKKLQLKKILTLTYEARFFQKLGFKVVEKRQIPEHKVWEDCIKCKKFPECNEIALIIELP